MKKQIFAFDLDNTLIGNHSLNSQTTTAKFKLRAVLINDFQPGQLTRDTLARECDLCGYSTPMVRQ